MVKPGMFISERYEVIEKVGSGGMADVYRAKCHRLNRYVAIKILKPEFSTDKSLVTKFRAEAQSAAGLSHPNIVSVYDVGDDGDLHYIVMELVEGITLKKFIERKGKLEIKEAIGIAIQIAQGLEAAHDNHIVHRDIKPQNIIISREGKVKVADFGIAKAATTNTVTQNAVGSVHYLSPEQARGGYSDEKSDIYSLGVTMYEMLCGKVPFAGDNTVSVALSHIQYEPVPVKEVNPAVPFSVDKIVWKCMQKRPENRYLSAAELIVDLKRSVMNPEGDFVRITAGVVSDSPTKNMTQDELAVIKSAAKSPVTRIDSHRDTGSQILKEEEEELDGSESKWDKTIIIASIAVILICMGAILFAVFKFLDIFGDGKATPTPGGENSPTKILGTATPEPTPYVGLQTIRLQNVVGRKLDNAKEMLYKQSEFFTILDGDTDYSDVYEKGMVISQYPLGGVDVALDEEIRLVISAGPELLTVPDYHLWNYTEARVQAENDFTVRIEFENSDVEVNRVIRTVPDREEVLAKGGELVLVVSRGEKVESMPNLIGMTLDGAKLLLEEKGFSLGNVNYAGSPTYGEGLVIYQSESVNNTLAVGTVIHLTVSNGIVDATPTPEPTPTPTLTPEPTPTPALREVWEVTLKIQNNPLTPGDSTWVLFELVNDSGTYQFYEIEDMSYNEMNVDRMTVTVDKDKLSGVENDGEYGVFVYVNGAKASFCRATVKEKMIQ